MSTTSSCPPPEKLEDLKTNRLSAAEAEALRQHLQICPRCEARARGNAPPDNTVPVRWANASSSSPARAYTFLSPPRAAGELGWLDEYRITGLLGDGGMSIVFEAEDTNLHRIVALKVLRQDLNDEVTRLRFLREARTVASLPHDHIVTVYQVGEANGVSYLTMERLIGETLQSLLDRDRWLPVAEALQITREAAEGLEVAHDRGLVHRDVKPANIWLQDRDNGKRRVKLIDFGIARQIKQTSSALTVAGQVLGTPMYMSPEQASGKNVDGRSDLYSLGCVLFHMVTGKAPFDGRNPDTVLLLQAIIQGNTPRVAELAPDLPPPVAQLIQQLLATNPDDRPRNATLLVERLRQLEQDACRYSQVTSAVPLSAVKRPLARRPALLGILLGAVAICAALVVVVVTIYYAIMNPSTADDSPGKNNEAANNGTNGARAKGKPTGPPLPIGIVLSHTGTVAVHERPIIHAMQMAIAEINETGGVLNRPIDPHFEDGESNETVFAQKAEELIVKNEVAALFGCWTSSSRKRVAEVCQKHDRLLFYPAGYEGLENSPNVVYLGGTPNQSIIPLVKWATGFLGSRRFFLVGSEYVYSHSIAAILEHEIQAVGGMMVGEEYVPLGETDFTGVIQKIKAAKPNIIINAIDGDSNLAFANALRLEGIRPKTLPTVWLSISESELPLFRNPAEMIGDYSTASYFNSLQSKENREFLSQFRKRYGPAEQVNDVMETAYAGIYLWKKAVEEAKSPHTEAVKRVLPDLSIDTPGGQLKLAANLHAYRKAMVGQIKAGSPATFSVVYSSPEPLAPEPFPQWRSEAEWKKFLNDLYVKWGNKWEKHK